MDPGDGMDTAARGSQNDVRQDGAPGGLRSTYSAVRFDRRSTKPMNMWDTRKASQTDVKTSIAPYGLVDFEASD